MDPRVRRAASVALPLVAWAALVAVAVAQGRALRDDVDATGSWAVLMVCSLGAVVALYAALVALLRGRVEADREAHRATEPPADRARPRHRA